MVGNIIISTMLEQLNKVYFWDIDTKKLDESTSQMLIIERIVNFGNLTELQLIRNHYGDDKIINSICSFKYLDSKTLNFLSLIFNIPKSRFKCYTEKPLKNQYWSY